MPSRPCLRCGRLSPGSYCTRHTPDTFNYAKRGSGRAATFRRRTLAQTGGACAVCGSRDRVQAHHLGDRDEDGGMPLCHAHHQAVTRARARARRART